MYLMQLLTRRETAKELRAFSATTFLRTRYDALTDDRISSCASSCAGGSWWRSSGPLPDGARHGRSRSAPCVWLLGTDRITSPTAVTAGMAMFMLASRLTIITGSLGKLVESSMFLDDYNAFLALASPAHAGVA